VNDAYSVALIFSQSSLRFRAYATAYASVLLDLGKQVVVFSPDYIAINEHLNKTHPKLAEFFKCYHFDDFNNNIIPESRTSALKRWYSVTKKIFKAERQLQTIFDLCFFAPLDTFLVNKVPLWLLDKIFPFKWTGLYLRPTHIINEQAQLGKDPIFKDPDYMFRSQNCTGATVIDRFISEDLKSRVYKKIFVLPEITNFDVDENADTSVLIELAAKRKIIGLISLSDNKGLMNFLKTMLLDFSDQYFYVFCGNPDAAKITNDERLLLDKALEKHNFFFLNSEDLEEPEINKILMQFDVCYLNYAIGDISNPILSKAAYFGIPVLASKNDQIGKIVDKFDLGMSINGQASENLSGIEMILNLKSKNKILNESARENYLNLHDEKMVKEVFEQLLML